MAEKHLFVIANFSVHISDMSMWYDIILVTIVWIDVIIHSGSIYTLSCCVKICPCFPTHLMMPVFSVQVISSVSTMILIKLHKVQTCDWSNHANNVHPYMFIYAWIWTIYTLSALILVMKFDFNIEWHQNTEECPFPLTYQLHWQESVQMELFHMTLMLGYAC